jgi:hypothetical protein
VHAGFRWGNLRKRDDLEDLGTDGKIILKWIFKTKMRAWTGLTWLRMNKRRDLVNAVMNFRVPQNAGKFLTS